tara:strand:- start:308 stop:2740 length:2433 start_codon:yes stop_codon:yes gene_type:complete
MRHFFFILLFIPLILPSLSYGQSGKKYPVKGTVVDAANSAPLEFATVSAFSTSDSSLAGGSITDISGNFNIEVAAGSYYFQIEFIGYTAINKGPFTIGQQRKSLNIGTVAIESKAELLKEAVVEAERSQVALSLEKKSFEVSQDLSSIGGTATDILENVPSVTVDAEGEVSLRGNSNVRILINGKQSGLVGISGSEALQMLPADQIERVEVITNPSARYDAEGVSGIINIILKEEKKPGTNGVLSLSAGYPQMFSGSANLSHQRGKWTFSGGYSFRNRSNGGFHYDERETYDTEGGEVLKQDEDMTRSSNRHGINGGLQFQPNTKNQLSISGNYRTSSGTNLAEVDYDGTNLNDVPTSYSFRKNEEAEDQDGYDLSFDYTKKFAKEKQEWVTTVNFNQSNEIEDTDAEQTYYNISDNSVSGIDLQHTYTEEFQQNSVFQSDYVHPLKGDGALEVGVKSSLRVIETDYYVEDYDNASDTWTRIAGLSNKFNYEEGIYAAYAMFRKKFNKFGVLAGVRVEYSDILTEQLETDQRNKRDYVDPFPTIHVSYQLDKINSVQLSYSRRIRRPNFWDLNPFFSYSNPYSYRSGNPNVNPEYTNSVEFAFLSFRKKWNINASVYYRHSYNVIQWISTVEDSTTYSMPVNVAERHSYGLELTGSYTLTEWWKVNGTLNTFGAQLNASNVENGRDVNYISATVQLSSMMNFKNGYTFQVRGNYQAPEERAQGKRYYTAYMNVALTKELFKGNATVSFKIDDVFNSRVFRSRSTGDNFNNYSEHQWRPRMFIIGFTYRLNATEEMSRRNRGEMDGGDSDM